MGVDGNGNTFGLDPVVEILDVERVVGLQIGHLDDAVLLFRGLFGICSAR